MRGFFRDHPKRQHLAVNRVCVCGTEFQTTLKRLEGGRGKYCSKACAYANHQQPRGRGYTKHVENTGWFQPGHAQPSGPEHPSWRGEQISYQELHRWVARNRTKPERCEHCGASGQPLDWANLSHEYRRNLDDWAALCRLCHRRHDSGDARGAATAKFGREAVQCR